VTPELGIIEGFYGRQWTWEERAEAVRFLRGHGYAAYMYAPKGDAHLRERWQEPRPADDAAHLRELAQHCHDVGVRFGIGLSPFEVYRNFDRSAKDALARKLAFYDEIGADDIAILFDDMRGDVPDLARRQADIVHAARAGSQATRFFMCPTYYSDDAVLDRVFGARPPQYLEQLGSALDPDVHVFWTGEEICAAEISPGHLRRVTSQLQRRPFLWDNYPVNDTPRMNRFLHIRGFTGRRAGIAAHAAGHFVNPALQPVLSRIPALTLVESYERGDDYAYGAAFMRAAELVAGAEIAEMLRADLHWLQDVGVERLEPAKAAELRERYARIEHPIGREVVEWLDMLRQS